MEYLNPARSPYTAHDRALIGAGHARQARARFARHPRYRPTPVHVVEGLAGTRAAYVKDESGRMGLGSFKALGGAYAVHLLAERDPGGPPFVCASAGNHGISVASGAAEAGVPCVVYLSENVPEAFARRLRALGAGVRRAGGDYEESAAAALAAAREHGWRLVADSSWEGYTDVPLDVMRGYGVLFDELADPGALPPPESPTAPQKPAPDGEPGGTGSAPPFTHVFVQAGVGGLAAAAAGYVRDRWGEQPRIVVVEPAGAPCLVESARAGRPVRVEGGRTTLGRLDCREPSLLAHDLLHHLADLYVTITDDQAADAARRLAAHGAALSGCGAAGAAGLLALGPAARRALALDDTSRVLLVGTEGPVEPE
ncbi:pyridoxal-phosphate dependent enzyme [Nonomuraea candida]|uniref:pyridoxal-phosphate dependent enzyme n=1 Tax=Nonomuraea candida TaxID=359159 RepID=UPI0005B7C349|nr:pyridoxal-phosphate dependent enzyme [Nonomuraea candida]